MPETKQAAKGHNHVWRASGYQPDDESTRLWCDCGKLAIQDHETGGIAERPGFLIIKAVPVETIERKDK